MESLMPRGFTDDNDVDLIAEMRKVGDVLKEHGTGFDRRLREVEASLNEHARKIAHGWGDYSAAADRDSVHTSAILMCQDRNSWRNQKNEGRWVEYAPSSTEIEEATVAQRAWRSILRHGDLQRLDDLERKSLSAFSFGNTGWVIPPEVSTRILSCLSDPDDVLSMFSNETISAGSIIYPIDDSEMQNVG
jgi:HK97 family phage major capsid protein